MKLWPTALPYVSINKMAFIPKDLSPENINVSPRHPLSEFFWLLGGLAGSILLAYFLLGLAVDWVVPYVPAQTEAALGKLFEPLYAGSEKDPREEPLQALVTDLRDALPGSGDYRLHIVSDAEMVNALALPGGGILVYSELLKQAESENELAFVLGHEIGHLYARHSLKRLGRGLVLMTLSDLLLGQGNILSNTVSRGLDGLQMSFSREQETAADEIGLKLLVAHYGHAGGATDFFQRLAQTQSSGAVTGYFSTHPQPLKRVTHLEQLIEKEQLAIEGTTPFEQP